MTAVSVYVHYGRAVCLQADEQNLILGTYSGELKIFNISSGDVSQIGSNVAKMII